MAVTPDKPGPYTAGSAITQFLSLNRSRGLPSTVNAEVLARAGIADSLIPRTLQALQTLDLINDAGAPTSTLEALRKAPEAEYKARMTEWLNATYADVLQFIDPAEADEVAIRDAFRNYNPIGQQSRMVSLFIALYGAAGVRPEKTNQPRPAATPRARPVLRTIARPVAPKAPEPRKHAVAPSGALPATISALLADLPPQGGGWTQDRRDKFIAMFESMLDYNYRIIEEAAEAGEADEEAA